MVYGYSIDRHMVYVISIDRNMVYDYSIEDIWSMAIA